MAFSGRGAGFEKIVHFYSDISTSIDLGSALVWLCAPLLICFLCTPIELLNVQRDIRSCRNTKYY